MGGPRSTRPSHPGRRLPLATSAKRSARRGTWRRSSAQQKPPDAWCEPPPRPLFPSPDGRYSKPLLRDPLSQPEWVSRLWGSNRAMKDLVTAILLAVGLEAVFFAL